ncbi:GRF-type domain-containing protein [Heracleum sosnowskyi]|uniref:GRF-type domain-containing protein n=1 Tax=Heracleum sosnowskyi TaxID=360622 RepID=A0AAD8JG39_9APIA|nr:GRF-type domain-containing protein [Heracleum sosnowskyi]
MAYQNSISIIASSSSIESVRKEEHKHCFCERRARLCTSWTLKNPGRRFFTTPKENNGCHFFQWFEEEFCGRSLDVITHLNHKRIYLEEKLKLVKENLAESIEKKIVLKAEKKLLIEGRMKLDSEKENLKKQLRLCLCVVVLLIAVVIFSK